MPKIEPVYEPRGQQDAFDGGEDDYEEGDGGSRLPLLIVIGLLVLAAFGGVVWLAYQHGVERGMKDVPRTVAGAETQATSPAYDKIYQKPAPADQDSANDDTAPPPPTPTFKPQAAAPAPNKPAPSQSTAATPPPTTAEKTTATAAPSTPAPSTPIKPTKVAAKPVAPPPVPASVQPQATKPPAKLVADTKTASVVSKPIDLPLPPTAPAPLTPAPSIPAPAATAASGDYVLQIGSYKSEDEASSSWKTYKARHAITAAHAESIKQVDLGAKGTWYRLRIGGFASKDEATSFCAKLKAGGGDCIPAKN